MSPADPAPSERGNGAAGSPGRSIRAPWLPEFILLGLGLLAGWGLLRGVGLPAVLAPRTPMAELAGAARTFNADQAARLRAAARLEAAEEELLKSSRQLEKARRNYQILEQKQRRTLQRHSAAVVDLLRASDPGVPTR